MSNQNGGKILFLLMLISSIPLNHENNVMGENLFQSDLNDGLILHLPMDQGAGNIAYDFAGTSNAEIFGARWFHDGTYIALEFDGESAYVRIEEHPLIETNAMSISVFVNYYEFSGDGWSDCIITQDDFSQTEGYMRYQLSTFEGRIAWIPMGDGNHLFSNEIVELNQWHHVVTTFDGQYHKLWLNTELQAEVEGSMPNIEGLPTDIGRKNIQEDHFYFAGLIDDVKIFESALSEEEIEQLYVLDHFTPDIIVNSNTQSQFDTTSDKIIPLISTEVEALDWFGYTVGVIAMVAVIFICVNTVIYIRRNSEL